MNNFLLKISWLALLLILSQASFSQSLNDSLKAHFNFERNTLDSSPNNNHLDSNGTLDWSTFFGQDLAIYFDGITRTKGVNSFDNSYFSETSISFWINTKSYISQKQMIIQGANMAFGVYLSPSNQISAFFRTPAASAITDTTTVIDSTWHHIVAQNNGDSTFLYIDGILKGKKYQPLMVGTGRASNRIFVGNKHDNSFPLTGSINDLRIYSRILTQSEIDSLSTYPTLSVGIPEIDENKKLVSIFPNPSSGAISLDLDRKFMGGYLKIRNIQGQLIYSQRINNIHTTQLKFEGKNGIYLAEVSSINGYSEVVKLIKR